jgi:hypothetical protein
MVEKFPCNQKELYVSSVLFISPEGVKVRWSSFLGSEPSHYSPVFRLTPFYADSVLSLESVDGSENLNRILIQIHEVLLAGSM